MNEGDKKMKCKVCNKEHNINLYMGCCSKECEELYKEELKARGIIPLD